MNILGIDYGDKKIGLAKSVGNLAVPLKILENKGSDFVFKNIENICAEEQIEQIVVGMPVSISNAGVRNNDLENRQMKKILHFVEGLKKHIKDVNIVTEDERLSTREAQKLSRGVTKSKDDDAVSAMLILQSYLDKNN